MHGSCTRWPSSVVVTCGVSSVTVTLRVVCPSMQLARWTHWCRRTGSRYDVLQCARVTCRATGDDRWLRVAVTVVVCPSVVVFVCRASSCPLVVADIRVTVCHVCVLYVCTPLCTCLGFQYDEDSVVLGVRAIAELENQPGVDTCCVCLETVVGTVGLAGAAYRCTNPCAVPASMQAAEVQDCVPNRIAMTAIFCICVFIVRDVPPRRRAGACFLFLLAWCHRGDSVPRPLS